MRRDLKASAAFIACRGGQSQPKLRSNVQSATDAAADAAPPTDAALLHAAIAARDAAALAAALADGADADARDAAGQTPLHAAAALQEPRLIQLLLNAGADAGAGDAPDGRTPLAYAAAAAASCSASHCDTLLCLARARPHLLATASPATGSTPLHELCSGLAANDACTVSALEALAAAGLLSQRSLQEPDAQGRAPLALAAAAGSREAVALLLACGAPAASACQRCSQIQAQAAECDDEHAAAHTCALGAAAAWGSFPILLTLLEAGASAAGLGLSAFLQAVAAGRGDVAAALLAAGLHCPASSALLAAVEREDGRMLRALLQAGLDPQCCGNDADAVRLLHAALQPGREALLQQLLPPPAAAGAPSSSQLQRLDLAALARRLQVNPALWAVPHASLPALRLLLSCGCPPGAVPAGRAVPPLVAAAARLDRERCRLLLEAGADARETDGRRRSALDAVLELCSDAALIELTVEETEGEAGASELQLLQLVELLVAAGASCPRFLADLRSGSPPELVHSSLLLALGRPEWAWAPAAAAHTRWPPAFRAASREGLLALHGRGVAVLRQRGGGRRGEGVAPLPLDVCERILAAAALPVSCWVVD